MASGDKEHRMLFDLRGRRRNVIKVIYAVLAVLMALSLFLIGTGSGIGELFNSGADTSEAAEQFEEQAARIERKLAKNPDDPDLLASLTRARINAANQLNEVDSSTGELAVTVAGRQQLEKASAAWSEYLQATDEPSAAVASLTSNALFTLAQTSRSVGEAKSNVKAASEAQEIVAEERPSVGSYSTLAFYTLYTFDYGTAEEAKKEAEKLATSKAERESIDSQYDEVEKSAQEFEKSVEEAEEASQGSGEESLENPLGGLGGTSLSE